MRFKASFQRQFFSHRGITMFDAGDLIYDPRLRMAGMILHIEERTLGDKDKTIELWYNVMLFGDPWCRDGKTRDYQMNHGDNILELYNPQRHKE